MNLLGDRCLVCNERTTGGELIECDTCGNELHDRCAEYYQTYDCSRCGEELWIGAHEI